MRLVAISGGPSLNGPVSGAIRLRGAGGGADGFEYLGEEARRLMVAVLAEVPFRGEELRAEIAMRRGHLDPIKSPLHRQRRAMPVRGDELLNLAG